MYKIFTLSGGVKRDPAIEVWFTERQTDVGLIAYHWFERMRECGTDVRELMHDGQPTVCVSDAAFAYVNIYKAHANLGFFHGAQLKDPAGLLEGSGKYMRHVKLKSGADVNSMALNALVTAAYQDIKARLAGD